MRVRAGALALALALCGALGLAALRGRAGPAPDSGSEAPAAAASGAPEAPVDDAVVEGVDELVEGLGAPCRRSERAVAGDVAEAAAACLERARDRGDCVIARSGYLDLSGRTWGCVLQGSGWVEVLLVCGGEGEAARAVSWRMDAADVARAVGGR